MLKVKEKIVCPQCGTIQNAEVVQNIPFWIYVHHCVECKYIITESEWQKVDASEYIDDDIIDELELFFKTYDNLPQMLLEPHLFVSEPQKFVEKHLYTIKNNKKRVAKLYLDLLMKYKSKVEQMI